MIGSGGSWNYEVGSGVRKLDMSVCGVSFEGWMGVDVDYRERLGGALEVSSY